MKTTASSKEDVTETTIVTLWNGQPIKVPIGTTKAQIREDSIASGETTTEEWHKEHPELTPTSDKVGILASDAGNLLQDNAEIVGGLGGAGVGAAIGSFVGPVGTVVGGIVGGALGTGTGSLLEDDFEGKDLDFEEAVMDAGLSVAIDVGTLGVGKLAKIGHAGFKRYRDKGLTPQQTADQIIAESVVGEGTAGSLESLKASQKLLTERGATLQPFQTGRATGLQLFGEKLGATGMVSSGTMERNAIAVNKAVNDSFEDLMTHTGTASNLDSSSIGGAVSSLFIEGKKALSTTYGSNLSIIAGKMAGKQTPLSPVRNALNSFVKKYDSELMSELDPKALSIIKEFTEALGTLNTTNSKSLISYQKTFNKRINALNVFGSSTSNPEAARQLTKLSKKLKEAIHSSLEMVDKPAALAYKTLNKSYAESIEKLQPKITKNIMAAANRGDFSAIGNALVSGGSIDTARALYKSIDESFAQLGGKTLHFNSSKEVKEVVRAGFLKNLMSDIGGDFNIKKYNNLASQWSTPNKAAELSLVMGDKYKPVKQLMNVMSEASKKPASNIGELALRAKEYAAGAGVVGSGFSLASLGALGAVFITPLFLATAAINPKNINRILAFEKQEFKGNKKAMKVAMTNIVVDVMNELSSDEQQELMDAVKQ